MLKSIFLMWKTFVYNIFQQFKEMLEKFTHFFNKNQFVEKCGKLILKRYFIAFSLYAVVECGKLLIFCT